MAILPFSWPFLALLGAMLLIALPLSHAGLAGTWWQTLPPASAAWWLPAEFAVLSAAAALCMALPPPDAVPIAGLAEEAGLVLPAVHRVPAGPMTLAAVIATVIALTRRPGGPARGSPLPHRPFGHRGTQPASRRPDHGRRCYRMADAGKRGTLPAVQFSTPLAAPLASGAPAGTRQ